MAYDLGTARGRIEVDTSSLGRATSGLSNMGKTLVTVGAAGVAGFAGVVMSAASLEKQISAVGAVSGATRAEMDLLRETALQLGANSAFSANEIAKAMEDLAKAGISVEDIVGGATQATINLAAAAGDELPGGVSQGAEIIANAMKIFGASADDMEHFADVLVGAAASSTLNVEDMAVSMKYAGPIAASLGFSIDDLSTALAILGDRGIKGSTAGTTLRGVLLSLTPSSAKATTAMKELGLITEDGTNIFYDAHGALKPLPEVMWLLGNATKNLSEQEKVAAFNAIFQRRAMNGAMILAEQGSKGFREYADAIAGIEAADVAAKKLDNLSGDITILQNRADALIKRVGLPLQEMVRGWVQWLTELADKLLEVNPELLAQITLGAGIAGVLFSMVGAGLILISILTKMWQAWLGIKTAMQVFAATQAGALLLNPYVLAAAAIIALGVALYHAYHRFQGVRDAIDTMIDGVQKLLAPLSPLVDEFMRIVSLLDTLYTAFREGWLTAELFGAIMASVLENIPGVNVQKLTQFFTDLYNGMQALWNWIQGTAIPAAQRFMESINWQQVLQIVGIALFALLAPLVALVAGVVWAYQNVEWFRDALQSAAEWINVHVVPVLQDFVDFLWVVGELVASIVRRMVPIWQAGINMWIALIQFFVRTAQTIWRLFGDNLLATLRNIWNLIRGVVEGALGIIRGIINVVTGLITGDWGRIWEGIKQIFSGAWNAIVATLRFILNSFVIAIQSFFDLVHLIWVAGIDFFSNTFEKVWNFMFEVVRGVLTAIFNFIKHIIDLIITPFQNLYNVLVGHSIIPDLMNRMREIIINGLNAIVNFFIELPGKVINAIQKLVGMVLTWASQVMGKMREGITSGISRVIETVRGIPGRVLEAIGNLRNSLLQKGKDLIQGFIDGIESMLGTLRNIAGDVAGAVTGPVGSLLGFGSPSRVFRQFGEWTIEGFTLGLEDKESQLMKTLRMFEPSPPEVTPLYMGPNGAGTTVQVNIDLTFPVTDERAEGPVRDLVDKKTFLPDLIQAVRSGVGGALPS